MITNQDTATQKYAKVSTQLAANLIGESYAIPIQESVRWMVPNAEAVIVDSGAECVAGDVILAWSNGSPILSKLCLSPPPAYLCRLEGDVKPMFVFEKEGGETFAVAASRIDSYSKVVGGIDANGDFLAFGQEVMQ